jgi:hypothetical protein
MISSILAFAAGIAAKIAPWPPAPKSNPETAGESGLDSATLHAEAMRVLAITREARDVARRARDHAKAESLALRDRNRILERQRADLTDHIGMILIRERQSQDRHAAEIGRLVAMTPLNPAVMPLYPQPEPAPNPQIEAQNALAVTRQQTAALLALQAYDLGHRHGGFVLPGEVAGMLQQVPTPFGYFDCTCVPGRADAFRNQQANAAD